MDIQKDVIESAHAPKLTMGSTDTAGKWIWTILAFVAACALSAALAFGNYFYYQWINGILRIQDAFLSALVYSAFLIVIGGLIVRRKPGHYGFQIGDSLKQWKAMLILLVAVVLFTIACLSLTPRTPYSGANWAVEMILVPFSEELMWRGVIFTFLFAALGRLHAQRTTLVLTVVFSAIAFGLAHVSNAMVHPISFVVLQMAFASIVGLSMGYARAKANSIYPAMVIHAAFNLIAILY